MSEDPSTTSARAMIASGRAHEAITLLLARLGDDPSDVQALSLLGLAFSVAGSHADALLFAKRAAEIAPDDEEVLANLATVTKTTASPFGAGATTPIRADPPAAVTDRPGTRPPSDNADILRELSALPAFVASNERQDKPRRSRHSDVWRMSAAGAISAFVAVAYVIFRLTRRAARETDDESAFTILIVAIVAIACVGAVVVATRWYLGLRLAPVAMRDAIAHDRRRRQSRLIVFGMVGVLGVVVIVALGAMTLVRSGLTPVTELTSGTCFMTPTGGSVPEVRTVVCTEPHDGEIVGIVALASLGSAFPGDAAVQAYAVTACMVPFSDYVGRAYRGAKDTLWLNTLAPQKSYWDQGMRTAWCVAQDPRHVRLDHSVRAIANR